MTINCQVCGEDGHCRDSEDPGVSTACPEGIKGCFFSDSSKISILESDFDSKFNYSEMMISRKCHKANRDYCFSWKQKGVSRIQKLYPLFYKLWILRI